MRFFHQFLMKLRMLFTRRRESMRLDAELQFHLEQQIAENLASGMSPEEARHAAFRLFGNPASLRDDARNSWSWNGLESFFRDIRVGWRGLRRTPGFSLIAVTVLALGIGATVTLFTIVQAVLLKPLPFPHQEQLVRVYEANAGGKFQDNVVSGGSFDVWRSQAKSFSGLAIKQSRTYNLSSTSGQLPEVIDAHAASWNLFPLLGVNAALGRTFDANEDRPSANGTVVLSWGLWKRRFGADPAILGKDILLDSRPYTVIGVLPAWFTYPDLKVQLWTALYHERTPVMMALFDAHSFDVVGRLKTGVSLDQATAELKTIQADIRKLHPVGAVNDSVNLRPILDGEVRQVRTGLYALLGATACLLLIACLNVANLFVARAASRRREAAIRTALGGSRWHRIREQVIESILLSAIGGVLGVALASFTVHWLTAVRNDIPRTQDIHIDGAVISFTLVIMLLCGLFAGLVPAFSSAEKGILSALQESSRSTSGGRDQSRLRKVLLATEIGITVVLLVGAGLLLKSYSRLRSVDLGYATNNILTMEIRLPRVTYPNAAKRLAFYEQLIERVHNLPGVEAAGMTTLLPGTAHLSDNIFKIPELPDLPPGELRDALTRFVDPDYFKTMQIPLVEGRVLLPKDRGDKGQVVVVNQEFVRRYFSNTDPIGKHMVVDNLDTENQTFEIVGVVGNTREEPAGKLRPIGFYPLYLGEEPSAALAIRTRSNPSSLALPVQQAVAQMDRNLPVARILTMNEIIGESTANSRFDAALLFIFAALSLLLSAVGIFGVLSYMVTQRQTEIGVRLALGAQRQQVLQLMLTDGLRPAIFGLVLGIPVSLALTRLLNSMLYGTSPSDPATFVAVGATLLIVAAAACCIPAWKASRLDPMQALRNE